MYFNLIKAQILFQQVENIGNHLNHFSLVFFHIQKQSSSNNY